jgi:hypothetical protein
MFDWQRFLDSHNIDYAERGRYHITHGYIGICCPFCVDDTGYNLGISLRNGFWHCWKEPVRGSHSGRAPYRLIERLLGCSRDTARAFVQAGDSVIASDLTFGEDIARKLRVTNNHLSRDHSGDVTLKFPDTYYRLNYSWSAKKRHYPYLIGRGYTEKQVDWLVDTFRLCCTGQGPFGYRVIIPVYMRGKLVTWTGRTIGDDELRYRTLSPNPENAAALGLPPAVMSIKDTLLDFDRARYGGNTLVVTEGPFDAMRVTFFGWRHGIRGVSLHGKQASPAQLELLAELVPHYRHVLAVFDTDAGLVPLPETLRIKQLTLPSGVKDPALLTREQFGQLFLTDVG